MARKLDYEELRRMYFNDPNSSKSNNRAFNDGKLFGNVDSSLNRIRTKPTFSFNAELQTNNKKFTDAEINKFDEIFKRYNDANEADSEWNNSHVSSEVKPSSFMPFHDEISQVAQPIRNDEVVVDLVNEGMKVAPTPFPLPESYDMSSNQEFRKNTYTASNFDVPSYVVSEETVSYNGFVDQDLEYLNALVNQDQQKLTALTSHNSIGDIFAEIVGNEQQSTSNYKSDLFEQNVKMIFAEDTDLICEENMNQSQMVSPMPPSLVVDVEPVAQELSANSVLASQPIPNFGVKSEPERTIDISSGNAYNSNDNISSKVTSDRVPVENKNPSQVFESNVDVSDLKTDKKKIDILDIAYPLVALAMIVYAVYMVFW